MDASNSLNVGHHIWSARSGP